MDSWRRVGQNAGGRESMREGNGGWRGKQGNMQKGGLKGDKKGKGKNGWMIPHQRLERRGVFRGRKIGEWNM